MGFIDAAANTRDQTVQGVKRGRCYRCMKHTRFAADVFAHNIEKCQETHIAWNVEQFVLITFLRSLSFLFESTNFVS